MMAQGSKDEVKVLLEMSRDLGYINHETFQVLYKQYDVFRKTTISPYRKVVLIINFLASGF